MTNRAGGFSRYRLSVAGNVQQAQGDDTADHQDRDFLKGTDDAAFLLSPTAEILGCNVAAERLIGVRRRDVLGRSCFEVLRCRDLLGHRICATHCPLLKAVDLGRPTASVEFLAQHHSGQLVGVTGGVLLLPAANAARALVHLHPCCAGIVDPPLDCCPPPAAQRSALVAADRPRRLPDLAGSLTRLLIATGADAAELFLVAPTGDELVLVAQRGRAARAFREIIRFDRGRGFPGLVAQDGEPILSLDLTHDDRYLRTLVKHEGFRFYLCVPICGDSRLLGTLHIASRRHPESVAPQIPFLQRVARDLGNLLELQRLREAAQFAEGVSPPLQSAEANLRNVAERALQALVDTASADQGMLLLARDCSVALEPLSECGTSPRTRRALVRLCDVTTCPAIDRRRAVVLTHGAPAESPLCRAIQRDLATSLCLPLEVEGKALGVVVLGYRHHVALPTQHLSFLHATIASVARLIHHARLALRAERDSGLQSEQQLTPSSLNNNGCAAGVEAVNQPALISATGMPFLDLRCFGRLTVLRDGRLVLAEKFARRRSITLLKILLTRYGQQVHREELVDLLWPEYDLRSARDMLNVVVHYLRRALDPVASPGRTSKFVVGHGDYYAFDTSSPHRLDSQDFIGLSSREAELERNKRPAEALQACQRAIELYTGDFLADEIYSDWCSLERAYLREHFLTLLRHAARLHLARGQVDFAVGCYRRALLADNTLEDVHRLLMEALWRAGRRDEALRQYRECRAVLERELDSAPLPETEALRQRIIANRPAEVQRVN